MMNLLLLLGTVVIGAIRAHEIVADWTMRTADYADFCFTTLTDPDT